MDGWWKEEVFKNEDDRSDRIGMDGWCGGKRSLRRISSCYYMREDEKKTLTPVLKNTCYEYHPPEGNIHRVMCLLLYTDVWRWCSLLLLILLMMISESDSADDGKKRWGPEGILPSLILLSAISNITCSPTFSHSGMMMMEKEHHLFYPRHHLHLFRRRRPFSLFSLLTVRLEQNEVEVWKIPAAAEKSTFLSLSLMMCAADAPVDVESSQWWAWWWWW